MIKRWYKIAFLLFIPALLLALSPAKLVSGG